MSDTMQQVVADGVTAFGAVEVSCRDLQGGIAVLSGIIDRGQAIGMRGQLTGDLMRARLGVASGYVSQALATIMELHIQATQIARDNGVEPASGGVRS